jgi:hypothetical protein
MFEPVVMAAEWLEIAFRGRSTLGVVEGVVEIAVC